MKNKSPEFYSCSVSITKTSCYLALQTQLIGRSVVSVTGELLIDITNDHGMEHFPTRERNTLDLSLTSLLGQF